MTEQEIFDTVLTHLREQGKASTNRSGGCRYRGEGGTTCAVGCLIPDELYDPLIEGLSVVGIIEIDVPEYRQDQTQELLPILARIKNHIGAEHLPLLCELQDAHDMDLFNSDLAAWEEEMHRIARAFRLKYTPKKFK